MRKIVRFTQVADISDYGTVVTFYKMLNKTEEKGCQEIISLLTRDEIIALAETVTKKQVKLTARAEAMKAILTYSETPTELLKRKRVKRDTLFQYLVSKEVQVSPNTDKSGLIRVILKSWGSQVDNDYLDDIDLEERKPNVGATNFPVNAPKFEPTGATNFPLNAPNVAQTGATNFPVNTPKVEPTGATNFPVNAPNVAQTGATNFHERVPNIAHASTSTQFNDDNDRQYRQEPDLVAVNHEQSTLQIHRHENKNSVPPARTKLQSTVVPTWETTVETTQKSELQVLGEKFAAWFYENLNSHNPVLQKTAQDFGPEHFWDDTYFILYSETPGQGQDKERFSGPHIVSQRFLAFSREELLLFNPNISKDGVFVKSDPHGLVMILVCGTIHRHNDCLGTFQQNFGIVKDPRFENNWKIKMTTMKVQTTQVTAIPKLEENREFQMRALTAP